MSPGIVLLLDERSQAARRQLGPLAWAVFERIALAAGPDGTPTTTSIRAEAEHLGIAKDTAMRAMAALRRLGMIEAVVPDRSSDGRFGMASYRVHPPEGVRIRREAAPSTRAPEPNGRGTMSENRGRRRPPAPPAAAQTLFDLT